MSVPTKLDHCVIHVTDWQRSNAFYTAVLGAELVERPAGYAYRFGDKQLNVHGPGVKPAEVARLPVAPGNSDLCFEWMGPIADAIAPSRRVALPSSAGHLQRCRQSAFGSGPMQRFGAKGGGHQRLFPATSRRLADGVHVVCGRSVMNTREASGAHDPTLFAARYPGPAGRRRRACI